MIIGLLNITVCSIKNRIIVKPETNIPLIDIKFWLRINFFAINKRTSINGFNLMRKRNYNNKQHVLLYLFRCVFPCCRLNGCILKSDIIFTIHFGLFPQGHYCLLAEYSYLLPVHCSYFETIKIQFVIVMAWGLLFNNLTFLFRRTEFQLLFGHMHVLDDIGSVFWG